MSFTIKAMYYGESDNLGQTFVLESDNGHANLDLEVGSEVFILPDTDSIVAQIQESEKPRLAPSVIDHTMSIRGPELQKNT